MIEAVVLDAGPLGTLSHPRGHTDVLDWLNGLRRAGTTVILPEIADYEVRRELLLTRKTASLARLDQLKGILGYLPLTTEAMLQAASLWAEVRRRGRPTADRHALDADVILAAQALIVQDQGVSVVVATTNVAHLSRFVDARRWQDIG
jgi:predicted nucleic acid-binding protein